MGQRRIQDRSAVGATHHRPVFELAMNNSYPLAHRLPTHSTHLSLFLSSPVELVGMNLEIFLRDCHLTLLSSYHLQLNWYEWILRSSSETATWPFSLLIISSWTMNESWDLPQRQPPHPSLFLSSPVELVWMNLEIFLRDSHLTLFSSFHPHSS